jgi:hypothetical protein
MTPLSFDPATAREVTGDADARAIEAKARADADEQTFCPPATNGETYWSQVQAAMRLVVYREQYTKRIARNERKKTPNVGGEARLAAHQPSHTTTATPQGVASTDQLGASCRSETT